MQKSSKAVMATSKSETEEVPTPFQSMTYLQMSREEQYDWLMFLLKANDKEIIEHIKENPRKATAVMRFDVFGNCKCSQDVEKGIAGSDNGKDSRLLLQRCVRYGLCPHILLLRHGYSDDNPLFYTEELFEQLFSNKELDTTERSTPNYSGLYWIHVAILTRKFDVVAELLPLLKSKGLMENAYTLCHKLNPLHLALLHDGVTLIDPLMEHFSDFQLDSVELQKKGLPIFIPEFLVLYNKVLALNKILPFIQRQSGDGPMLFSALIASAYNSKLECFKILLNIRYIIRKTHEDEFIAHVSECDDKILKIVCEHVYTSPTLIKGLIYMAIAKDNLELCNILMTTMLKCRTDVINKVTQDNSIVWYAILGRNPQMVSLLMHNKFRVTLDIENRRNTDLLKWATILKLPAICEMLIAAGCVTPQPDQHNYRSCCVINKVFQSPRSTTMKNVKILVEESGFDPNEDADDSCMPPVYSAARMRNFDLVEYLLMNRASLKINKRAGFVFHGILGRTQGTWREHYNRYWCPFVKCLIDSNAQFLVHFDKAMVFDVINFNVVLFDIFYRLSHTIPYSVQQYLEEYHATCDITDSASLTEDEGVDQPNKQKHEIIEALLYKPRSLQMASRNAFRKRFGSEVSVVISSLGNKVPRRVIDFLNFHDVISDLEEHLKYEK